MMGRIEKTVFISYRRTNLPWALAIYQDLTHHGYDVFFDYNSIKSGDFEQVIMQNIKGRAHFVVLLTPTALDRCDEPDDWLRREIELAIDSRRNIVPVFFEDFNFGSPTVSRHMKGRLNLLKKYNGMAVYPEYFDASMARLRNDFLSVPLQAVLHPISIEVQKVVQEQQSAANKVELQLIETCSFCKQPGQPDIIRGKSYCSNCGQPWTPSLDSPEQSSSDERSEFTCPFCRSTNLPTVLPSGKYCSDCGSRIT